MKKYLIGMIIICFIVSTIFVVSGCKTETTEEAVETVEKKPKKKKKVIRRRKTKKGFRLSKA